MRRLLTARGLLLALVLATDLVSSKLRAMIR